MMSKDYQLIDVKQPDDWADYHDIRRTVLFEAKGRFNYDPNRPEDYSPLNQSLLLKFRGQAIGTTRLDRRDADTGVIRLVAIRSGLQGQGHGRVLAAMVEDRARAKNLTTLFVNAAPDAVGYYTRLGYAPYAFDPSELIGIASECLQMRKQLAAAP